MKEGQDDLKSPYPYFGGKSKIAHLVWERFGDVPSYVEPFFGSGAVLLLRPDHHIQDMETVNDLDCYVANFWRAIKADPEQVAHFADNPANENDLHARHAWLSARKHDKYRPKIEGDPDYYCAKAAGWWVWGMACWIGGGFTSGDGPWHQVDGQLLHLGNRGQGVQRQLLHFGDRGRGVQRRRLHLGNRGRGILEWFDALACRFERVRVCCGDWSRICTETPTIKVAAPCGVFLDPPYADTASRADNIYAEDDQQVAHDVREWALERADDKRYRICLCGYEGEHELPDSWDCVEWSTSGGYASRSNGNGKANKVRERLWFSPHCLKPEKERLLFS